jgi:5-methylcytosine-specific restriction endonuclease McrA
MTTNNLADLSDDALLAETKRVAEVERRAMAELLTLLIEVERRHLCEKLGCPSLFAYCTHALGLSEQAAYSRITAARAIRRVPAMLPMLADGALTLTSVGLLAPHLTDDNQDALLAAAQHRSSRAVEKIVATVHAQPDLRSSVRAVAAPAPDSPRSRAVVALLRHVIPTGDPAAIVERALALLVKDAERTKFSATRMARTKPATPRAADSRPGRMIRAGVKRAVWKRDHGQCAFVSSHGCCGETGFVEFHHVIPFADGGDTSVENLQLRCRAHNVFEAREYFAQRHGSA